MKHSKPRGKVLKWAVLTTIALIAMRLFNVQDLIPLFLIFATVLACVAALLVAGVLLNPPKGDLDSMDEGAKECFHPAASSQQGTCR